MLAWGLQVSSTIHRAQGTKLLHGRKRNLQAMGLLGRKMLSQLVEPFHGRRKTDRAASEDTGRLH